jgi:asparagine N-glycosylation enzyme membrane subunit Stt3
MTKKQWKRTLRFAVPAGTVFALITFFLPGVTFVLVLLMLVMLPVVYLLRNAQKKRARLATAAASTTVRAPVLHTTSVSSNDFEPLTTNTVAQSLTKLAKLRGENLITDSEYREKRKVILDQL